MIQRCGSALNTNVHFHHRDGFDLHADTAVRAGDRRRLERLCRYVLRPPLAQEALVLTPEGRVLLLQLRRPWRDGTRAIRFEPSEPLEKLAALVPRPRVDLRVPRRICRPRLLAGRARDGPAAHRRRPRRRAGRAAGAPAGRRARCGDAARRTAPAAGWVCAPPPRRLGRACCAGPSPSTCWRARSVECGGRLRLLATIADPGVIARILAHLGLPLAPPPPAPARQVSWLTGSGA